MTMTKTSMMEKLAINGGPKIAPNGLSRRRLFGVEEKHAVMELFDRAIEQGSDIMGYDGEQEKAYCQAFCDMLGGGYADGVNSGTNAVYVALAATNPPSMSEIVVPPISDAGGIMPVTMLNCIPVAADAAPSEGYNTNIHQIQKVITDRTHAILIAHISGLPVDMDPILELAETNNLYVVEDCAQAHGALYKGTPVGTLAARLESRLDRHGRILA